MCSDGIVTELVLFAKEAHWVIGKPVMTLMRTDGAPREFAARVTQKCTFVVSVS
jgi:hypothetical protein